MSGIMVFGISLPDFLVVCIAWIAALIVVPPMLMLGCYEIKEMFYEKYECPKNRKELHRREY